MNSATARDSKASFVAPYLYRIGERYPQKGPVLGIFMRSLTEYIGLVGIGVSGLIVLIAVGLLVLAVILMGVGAYESATNPNIGNQTAQEYAQLQSNISNAQAGISGAVANVTGGQ